jgi:hypothetical protein
MSRFPTCVDTARGDAPRDGHPPYRHPCGGLRQLDVASTRTNWLPLWGSIGSCAATTAGVGSGGGDPALAAEVRECHDAG